MLTEFVKIFIFFILGALVVFAVATYFVTHSLWTTLINTVICAIIIQVGYFVAVLAMIFCLTPGTAWAELSLDRSTLIIHVFDLQDDAAFIALVKTRYERPLMEIFES